MKCDALIACPEWIPSVMVTHTPPLRRWTGESRNNSVIVLADEFLQFVRVNHF
jgi:hypothetical protein